MYCQDVKNKLYKPLLYNYVQQVKSKDPFPRNKILLQAMKSHFSAFRVETFTVQFD